MNSAVDFDSLKDYLQADENILLALVFGSATGISKKFNTAVKMEKLYDLLDRLDDIKEFIGAVKDHIHE